MYDELMTAIYIACVTPELQMTPYESKYDDCFGYSCPVCKDEKLILYDVNYCMARGQVLEWSDEK